MPTGYPKNGINRGWFKKGHIMKNALNLNGEMLFDLYINQEQKICEIARRLHITRNAVTKYLKLNGIVTRKKGWKLSDKVKEKMSIIAKRNGYGKWMKGKKSPISVNRKISKTMKQYRSEHCNSIKKLCLTCSKEISVFNCRKHITKFCSFKCKGIYMSKHRLGKNNSCWRGGITSLSKLIRCLDESTKWRKSVFQRDNFTCQICNIKGGKLHAHHSKKSFKQLFQEFLKEYSQFSPIDDKETLIRLAITYKDFWDISNGQTLCEGCHLSRKIVMDNDHKIKEGL